MKILLSWLQEFVPIDKSSRELATDLSLLGFAVDAITTEGEETVLDIDVTTNRPDALSHYGMAREIAARYGMALSAPATAVPAAPRSRPRGRTKDAMVEIAAPELCRRYSARVIRGVEVKPSPDWLASRLERVGVRSINNVADATNYILMAYGHPMHAFDLDRLEGGRILVRRAEEGEPFTTLDSVQRKLTAEDLVIADAGRAVALAGVMGGLDTEISGSTRNVLLESAWFDPVGVRRTSKRQGLHTEASHRFERGADIEATLACADRCIELIRELAGGEIDAATVDAYPRPMERRTVLLHRWELSRHLGLEIPPEEVERILYSLEFHPRAKGRTGWTCTVPSFRVDISREIDLVEEVARHYGYERFPMRLPASSGEPSHNVLNAAKEESVRALLLGLGYDETIANVLVSRATEDFGDGVPVVLSNPLNEEAAILRTSLIPRLLDSVQWNLNRGQSSVRMFEIGKVYFQRAEGRSEPPAGALVAVGKRDAEGVNCPAGDVSFFDVKGDVEQLIGSFSDAPMQFVADGLPEYYRPGQSARVLLDGKTVARLGLLRKDRAERWKLRPAVFLAEFFLDVLYALPERVPQARQLSRYPSVERDFSIVLPDSVSFEAVRKRIFQLNISELTDLRPIEIFRGSGLEKGNYSLLLRVVLQSSESTLTEVELTACSDLIIQAVETGLGGRIRMGG